jgi:hypothetical protein
MKAIRPACPRSRRLAGTTPPLILLLALVLAGVLVGAAPASAAQPGMAQESLALAALQQQQLTGGADGAAGDLFGFSVAVSGDTALVGATTASVGGNGYQGEAYLFTRSGGAWALQQMLTADDGQAGDCFGWSVALSGDTALVGAPDATVGTVLVQGAAYVFTRSGASWTQEQKLTGGDGVTMAEFGYSVALAGDTALIGARWDDADAAYRQGAAYVFTRAGAVWTRQQQLIAGDGAAGDAFGSSVALSGDVALVGAPSHDVDSNIDQGAAYVFTGSGASWLQGSELVEGTSGDASDAFGSSVALCGDTALVGAYSATVNGSQLGAAYVFSRSSASWALQQRLTGAVAGSRFGYSVALAADTALIGAPSAGQVCAYSLAPSGSTWVSAAPIMVGDGAADGFGSSVALAGDTALVGAPLDDVVNPDKKNDVRADQGSAYVFALQADGVAPVTSAALAPAANAAGWRKAVTVALTASDDLSGVASRRYRQLGAVWTSYAAPFVITTQGVSTWEYCSTDLAGNLETPKSFTVKIDGRKPTTKAYTAVVKKGKKVSLAYVVSDASPGCGKAATILKIYLGKTLKKTISVGTTTTNAKHSYSWLCSLPKGSYVIYVYATDIAGNAQSKLTSAKLLVK